MAVIDNDVVRRLAAGAPLDDLPLPRFEGRVDLRGARFDDLVVGFDGPGSWIGIDFSGATFAELMVKNLSVDNCRFDKAALDGMSMWKTEVRNTSFVGASLREAALGTVDDMRLNVFENVDFSRAKMRDSTWIVAEVNGCKFDGLKGVEFEGTQFSNCSFVGSLEELRFQQFPREAIASATFGRDHRAFGPNPMANIDFSKATFLGVGFEGLNLEGVHWPVDRDHLVLDDYPEALQRGIAWLEARGDTGAMRVADWLRAHLDVAGSAQKRGVLRWSALEKLAGGPIDELRAQLLGR